MSMYDVPVSLIWIFSLTLKTTLKIMYYYYPYFIEDKTEV